MYVNSTHLNDVICMLWWWPKEEEMIIYMQKYSSLFFYTKLWWVCLIISSFNNCNWHNVIENLKLCWICWPILLAKPRKTLKLVCFFLLAVYFIILIRRWSFVAGLGSALLCTVLSSAQLHTPKCLVMSMFS